MERTANGGDFRANLSRGGSGRMVTLNVNEQQQCVQAAKAVGLEFAGIDLIREYAKAPNFFITEINGNPGTGIIDITGYNYFVDLVQYIEAKTGEVLTTNAATTDTSTDSDDSSTQNEEAGTIRYSMLATLERNGHALSATQYGQLAFYKRKYGPIQW